MPSAGEVPGVGRGGAARDRRVSAALFGTGRSELSVTLATGYTVTGHTDGCLPEADRHLYGDLPAWFRAQTIVNNLQAEAQANLGQDPRYRSALNRWTSCVTPTRGPRPAGPDPALAKRCGRRGGPAKTKARLEQAELNRVRLRHRDQIALYQRLRTRAAGRAAALVPSAAQ
ncbi:hypothetical protein ACSNOI_14425 [Actinomadura kijaniata]|uniref:hypothetical protein n=1 Tax=Actinomadura kijaniata TaxID=46161 RepID=UPI003F1AFE8D